MKKSSGSWHALQGGMYWCRAEQVVLYYSMWCTNAAVCHTKYAQSLYSKVDQVAGLQRHRAWECSGHNPVLSMYWVRTQYIQRCTWYVLWLFGDEQAYAHNCSGSVCLDINLLRPSRIEFVHHPAPLLAMSGTQASKPQWLEYIYRTAHPVLRWLPTKLAEWIGENL